MSAIRLPNASSRSSSRRLVGREERTARQSTPVRRPAATIGLTSIGTEPEPPSAGRGDQAGAPLERGSTGAAFAEDQLVGGCGGRRLGARRVRAELKREAALLGEVDRRGVDVGELDHAGQERGQRGGRGCGGLGRAPPAARTSAAPRRPGSHRRSRRAPAPARQPASGSRRRACPSRCARACGPSRARARAARRSRRR